LDFIYRLVSQDQKIIDKELETPKRPTYKPQNNKPEQIHTHTHTKLEYTNGNKTTRHDTTHLNVVCRV